MVSTNTRDFEVNTHPRTNSFARHTFDDSYMYMLHMS